MSTWDTVARTTRPETFLLRHSRTQSSGLFFVLFLVSMMRTFSVAVMAQEPQVLHFAVHCPRQSGAGNMSGKRPKVANEYESLWVKPHQIDEKRWERDAVSWPARAAQTHGGRLQDVSTKAAQGDIMALALLREMEDDTGIAAKISEGPSPLQTPKLSKLAPFAMVAFTQLAYTSESQSCGPWRAGCPSICHTWRGRYGR